MGTVLWLVHHILSGSVGILISSENADQFSEQME